MIATKETIRLVTSLHPDVTDALNSTSEGPQYKMFERLGIVLYSGVHAGRIDGDIKLER